MGYYMNEVNRKMTFSKVKGKSKTNDKKKRKRKMRLVKKSRRQNNG